MSKVLAIASLIFCLNACTVNAPLSEDYYSGTDKIAGGNAPSVPQLVFDKPNLKFDFTASIDPETASEVTTYLIYIYPGVPTKFYETRYLDRAITTAGVRTFYLTSVPYATMSVVVTGFDGYRESAVNATNMVTFDYP